MIARTWNGEDGMMHAASDLMAKVYPYIGLIIVGIIVGYALLTGGSS